MLWGVKSGPALAAAPTVTCLNIEHSENILKGEVVLCDSHDAASNAVYRWLCMMVSLPLVLFDGFLRGGARIIYITPAPPLLLIVFESFPEVIKAILPLPLDHLLRSKVGDECSPSLARAVSS